MRRLRYVFYIREAGYTGDIGAHLAPVTGTRTLCNRSTRGREWRGADRKPEGRILPCKRCLTLAGTCSVCGATIDAHFSSDNRWTGCLPVRRLVVA
jgi:hypothetical protein